LKKLGTWNLELGTWNFLMKETVEMIVKALVDDTEAVEVREVERRDVLLIEVRVAEADMGKLIGRQGRTVRALRSLLHAASVKQNRRYILEIVE
jgi:predicted RNA-binding protein YlqC (UPF0109 family)